MFGSLDGLGEFTKMLSWIRRHRTNDQIYVPVSYRPSTLRRAQVVVLSETRVCVSFRAHTQQRAEVCHHISQK